MAWPESHTENQGEYFANELGEQNLSGWAQEGNVEAGPCGRRSEPSKTKGPERLAWPEQHTENQGEGFAKELGERNWSGWAQEGNVEAGPCGRHSEPSKTNGPERLAWPESHTENRGEGFAKELGERNRPGTRREGTGGQCGGWAMRLTERTFGKQMVRSDWSGRIRTRKIKEKA